MTRREDNQVPAGDYLWDGTGTPDPEVARLEGLLSSLKHTGEPPEVTEEEAIPEAVAIRGMRRRRRYAFIGVAAAALTAAAVWWAVWKPPSGGPGPVEPVPTGPAWAVEVLKGEVEVGKARTNSGGHLRVNEWVQTDATAEARIKVPDELGTVTVKPGTRLQLVATTAQLKKLALAEGEIHAFIKAPPRIFVVDTQAATAVDMGCEYTLRVDADGYGELTVLLGKVELVNKSFRSIVVAGTLCRVDGQNGPGVPRDPGATSAFVTALHDLEKDAGDSVSLMMALSQARTRDSVSLWHLIPRTSGDARSQVIKKLIELTPPPDDIQMIDVQNLDETALDRWWNVIRLEML